MARGAGQQGERRDREGGVWWLRDAGWLAGSGAGCVQQLDCEGVEQTNKVRGGTGGGVVWCGGGMGWLAGWLTGRLDCVWVVE